MRCSRHSEITISLIAQEALRLLGGGRVGVLMDQQDPVEVTFLGLSRSFAVRFRRSELLLSLEDFSGKYILPVLESIPNDYSGNVSDFIGDSRKYYDCKLYRTMLA